MNKKGTIGGLIAAVMIAVVTAWNVNLAKQEVNLSDVAMANVEALAQETNSLCINGCVDKPGVCICNGAYPYAEATWP